MEEMKRMVQMGFETMTQTLFAQMKSTQYPAKGKEKLEAINNRLDAGKTRQYPGKVEAFEPPKTWKGAKLKEKLDAAKKRWVAELTGIIEDWFLTPEKLRLEFRNGIASEILTSQEIKGEEGVPIVVALVDDSTGHVVDDGQAASAKVEIVLLKIEPKLQNGVAILKDIKISKHALKIKPSKFMLGARVVGDCCIKEAKTNPFTFKDYRAQYYKKKETPSLGDKVSVLNTYGQPAKRLQGDGILTVEDFLVQLLRNPLGLKNTVKLQKTKWEGTVRNARACLIGRRVYFYMDPEQKRGIIIFNILGDVLRLHPNTLSEEQEADLLASAYENWNAVKASDDHTSLDGLLASLTTSMDAGSESSFGMHDSAYQYLRFLTDQSHLLNWGEAMNSQSQAVACPQNPESPGGGGGETGGQDFGSLINEDNMQWDPNDLFGDGAPWGTIQPCWTLKQ